MSLTETHRDKDRKSETEKVTGTGCLMQLCPTTDIVD